jgi:hypothetical protein
LNWTDKTLEQIVGGKNPDGSSMLVSFLKYYSEVSGVKVLNAGCSKCLQQYYKDLKQKHIMKNNKSTYRLHAKFNNIPLRFGSSIFVNNENITDELAEALVSRYIDVADAKEEEYKIDSMFEKYPENWEEAQYTDEDTTDEDTTDEDITDEDTTGQLDLVVESEKNADEDLTFTELKTKYPDVKANSKVNFLKKLKA